MYVIVVASTITNKAENAVKRALLSYAAPDGQRIPQSMVMTDDAFMCTFAENKPLRDNLSVNGAVHMLCACSGLTPRCVRASSA